MIFEIHELNFLLVLKSRKKHVCSMLVPFLWWLYNALALKHFPTFHQINWVTDFPQQALTRRRVVIIQLIAKLNRCKFSWTDIRQENCFAATPSDRQRLAPKAATQNRQLTSHARCGFKKIKRKLRKPQLKAKRCNACILKTKLLAGVESAGPGVVGSRRSGCVALADSVLPIKAASHFGLFALSK